MYRYSLKLLKYFIYVRNFTTKIIDQYDNIRYIGFPCILYIYISSLKKKHKIFLKL